MGAHWNTQNTLKYNHNTLYCDVFFDVFFDVFCVVQWAPITILPPFPGLAVSGEVMLDRIV